MDFKAINILKPLESTFNPVYAVILEVYTYCSFQVDEVLSEKDFEESGCGGFFFFFYETYE